MRQLFLRVMEVYRLGTVKVEYGAAMETLAYENAVPVDVGPPPLRGDVWLLGRRYSLPQERLELSHDVRSRLWFTYRKNFKPISGTSITCDQGWGCTLRCGQMVMGNILLFKHLGRDWRWPVRDKEHPEHTTYMKILRMFLDKKDSEYSLHMIAHQGADFGRPVGQWFGPNNVAQALKKLSTHDSWTRLAVHVALDMVVVVEDMKALCRAPHLTPRDVSVELDDWEKGRSHTAPDVSLDAMWPQQGGPLGKFSEGPELGESSDDLIRLRKREVAREMAERLRATHTGMSGGGREEKRGRGGEGERGRGGEGERGRTGEGGRGRTGEEERRSGGGEGARGRGERAVATEVLHVHSNGIGAQKQRKSGFALKRRKKRTKVAIIKSADFDRVGLQDLDVGSSSDDDDCFTDEVGGAKGSEFRSLLLFIPLRLGQEKFNSEYTEALKACLTMPQSAGIIGGKPRHALYFIGYHGDDLLYLDPHTTQPAVSSSHSAGMVPDQSYHCSQPDRMNIADLDPSVALAFFCKDESDVDDLCHRLKENVLSKMHYMFELTEKRPVYWGPVERNPLKSIHEPFLLVNGAPPSPQYTCEEDSDGFEVIDYA